MQMTTREAVKAALYSVAYSAKNYELEEDEALSIASVLCEHYGFKLSQFFDVEVVE